MALFQRLNHIFVKAKILVLKGSSKNRDSQKNAFNITTGQNVISDSIGGSFLKYSTDVTAHFFLLVVRAFRQVPKCFRFVLIRGILNGIRNHDVSANG